MRISTEEASSMTSIDSAGFAELMRKLARAWEARDTRAAVECFTHDAVYVEPPDLQFYTGHQQLHAYFDALTEGTFMRLHNLWFDEEAQIGAAEYSFGTAGAAQADHGVVVVELRERRIAFWREYQRKGSNSFADFIAVQGKQWRWSIENYP
jgi:hypothetical protein